MKLIFLDFDGVLNSEQSLREMRLDDLLAIDAYHVRKLKRLVDETGAEVVVSSSWRLIHTVAELERYLEAAGYDGGIRGCTPNLNISYSWRRPREIAHYLEGLLDVEAFVILDDDESSGQGFERVFVRTTPEMGLQDEHVEKAIAILSGGVA